MPLIIHQRVNRFYSPRLFATCNAVLTQIARLLDCLGRTIGVVIGHRFSDRAVRRRWTAIGNNIPNLDLGVAGTGVICFPA